MLNKKKKNEFYASENTFQKYRQKKDIKTSNSWKISLLTHLDDMKC